MTSAAAPGLVTNSLAARYADLLVQLDPERNNGLTATAVPAHSNRRVTWLSASKQPSPR